MANAICLGELLIDFVPTVTGTGPDRRAGVHQGAGRRARQCGRRVGATGS